MPDLNRIRICNIKYNDGNNYYDDFLIKLGGKNTYIDLINGVGKTFYMQCINQPILPNSKFDEKKSISVLFNKLNRNKVFHSIMEFRLDQGSAYKYAMVGLCTYAKETENKPFEEEPNKSNKRFDMFRYICLYNKPNEFDIENFPLCRVDENGNKKFISKNTLERTLKDLQNKGVMDYAVIINETNWRHFEELAKLNINQSEFAEMIELNKYEGNSANYLKPFQKGKDFILITLIPIIEKSYQLRNSDDFETSEARANTLITLRKTLGELQKKEALRDKYEYVQSELVNIVPKIEGLLYSYNERDKVIYTLSKYKKIVSYNKTLNEENTRKVSENIKNAGKLLAHKKDEVDELNKEKDGYEIKEVKLKFEISEKEHAISLNSCKNKEEKIKEIEDKKLRYECEKHYRTYLDLKEMVKVNEESISALAKDNELIISDYNYWGCYYKKALNEEFNRKSRLYSIEKDRFDKLNDNKFKVGKDISALEADIRNLEGLDKANSETLLKLDKEIKDTKKGIFHLLKEDITKQLNSNNELLNKKQEELTDLKGNLEKNKAAIIDYENEIKLQEQDIENKSIRLKELLKEIDKYNGERFNYDLIRGKYTYQEETISKYLKGIGNNIKEDTRKIDAKITGLNTTIRDLENKTVVSLSDCARHQFDIISASYKSAILGSSFLENKTLEERKVLFEITELIPYGIIVDKYDFNKIINDISLRRKFNDEVVPIINSEVLHGIGVVGLENLAFTVRDKECFVDPEFSERQLVKLKKEVEALTIEQLRLNNDLNSIENDYNSCINFEIKYNQEEINQKEQIAKKLEKETNNIFDAVTKAKENIKTLEKEIQSIERKLVELEEIMSKLSDIIKGLEEELADYETLDKLSKERMEIEATGSINKDSLEEFNIKLLQKKIEAEEIDKVISEISIRVDGLNKASIEVGKELKEFSFLPINEITIFEEDVTLSEIKSKFQLYRKNVEGSISDLQTLQDIIAGLNQSIEDVVKEIVRKNKNNSSTKYNIEYFNSRELFTGDYNNYLEELEKSIRGRNIELKNLNEIERKFKTEFDSLKATINNMCDNFKKKYNGLTYEEMNLSDTNIKERLDKIDIALNSIEAEISKVQISIKEFYETKDVLEKEIKNLIEYDNTVNRVADRNGIQLNTVELEDFNQSLNGINTIEGEVYGALSSLENTKLNYESALDRIIKNLMDSDLVHFKEDLENLKKSIPVNKDECTLIIDRLQGEQGYIKSLDEEKERISSIINELKEDEEIFINQLLQKCEQVYGELLNLTYLSKININGKVTSMIEVIVKPADEIIRKARMKSYINHLVNELQDVEESKRLSYLANNLTLKDLFSQFVDNINNCDVKIYKVDAIESNSKSISWAEVIGSTGQSNGMAYNIFICLISFIKKLYNPHIGDESRKFVMFDAPFSGMSASYIWEPIIKLLDENNFQVLCLGYGMPSNLLPLFDVKYYLGTEVNNAGTQTVVIKKLKSEVDLDKLSYKKLVGEQISMIE
jgi:chromosome segregation ATPase